MASYGKIICQC